MTARTLTDRSLTEPELEALCAHALRLVTAGQLDDAVLVLGGIVAVAPRRAEAWRALGEALERLGLVPAAALVQLVATWAGGSSDPAPSTLALLAAAARQLSQQPEELR
jgi:Flp pilus assembly protein TadD